VRSPAPAREKPLRDLHAQVEGVLTAFVQSTLDPSAGRPHHGAPPAAARDVSPRRLWQDAIRLFYRLLFRLRAEASGLAAAAPLPAAPFGPHTQDTAALLEQLRALPLAGLPVEELGRVYEALLDREPGLAVEPMARLRRGKLEAVVPAGQAEPYRPQAQSGRSGRGRVVWVEDIAPGRFFLRTIPGRKTSGSYYTPPDLVRFLVRETLQPLVEAVSPAADPRPRDLLRLTVLDPAMGSGHFLIEACRFLGARLFDTCRACADRQLRDRLPDEVAPHLRGTDHGATAKAQAACRRLVASHCLYGIDQDALAVEVARLCLWLEAADADLSWAALERHLLHGDSLTGPALRDLTFLEKSAPEDGEPDGMARCLRQRLEAALREHRRTDALAPFQALALAWTGAVTQRADRAARAAYEALLAHVAETGSLPDPLPPAARRLVRQGAAAGSGEGPAVAFDLAFPGVCYPQGLAAERQGFHAVLGNPPWDAIRPAHKEFFAAHDIAVLDAPTARERRRRLEELAAVPDVRRRWRAYRARVEGRKACYDRLYRHQKVRVGGDLAGRYADQYRVFAERAVQLLRPGGRVGLVLPSAFHAAEGATGLRRLYLEEMALRCCYSFENRRRLFPIDARCKFALVVAERGGVTSEFPCAFYLDDPRGLFDGSHTLRYTRDFVRRTGGPYLTFLEPRSPAELAAADRLLSGGRPLHSLEASHGVVFRTEPYAFNVTTHGCLFRAPRPSAVEEAAPASATATGPALPLLEGKYFHQFTDRWGDPPRYRVPVAAAAGRPAALANAGFYRLAFRTVAHATNERTAIFTVLPPGVLVSNSVAIEAAPERRPDAVALWVCAAANSFVFDFSVRLRGGSNMNLFIMRGGTLPTALPERFLAHAALRLVCNHPGFAPLWDGQLGSAWREAGRPSSWPALPDEAERSRLRATMDAAVAAAHGLTRREYETILGTFRPKSCPAMPAWCLERFDECERIGLDTFTRRHDPYWDAP
jgi:hypothetical protein